MAGCLAGWLSNRLNVSLSLHSSIKTFGRIMRRRFKFFVWMASRRRSENRKSRSEE